MYYAVAAGLMRNRVIEVHGLTFGLRAIQVNECDFRRQTAEQESVSERGANVADPNDSNAHGRGKRHRLMKCHT